MGLEREFFLPVDLEIEARRRCLAIGDDWESENEAVRNKWRLIAAIGEVERLRYLAGAVTAGPTAAEIKTRVGDNWRDVVRAAHVDCDDKSG